MRLLALLVLLTSCDRPAESPPSPAPPPAASPSQGTGKITVGVVKSPPGTLVMDPETGAVLGSAPGTFEVDRGIDPIRLEFVNPEYIPERRIITPDQDVSLSVPMRYRPRRLGEQPPPDQR